MTENELRQLLIDKAVEYCDCDGHIIPSILAEIITNAGYRKVPDGAVVLSKDEYDDLNNRPSTREWVETCRGRIEQARKETAREMLSWLKAEIQHQQFNYTFGLGILEQMISYKAKEYGVEVEE